MPIPPESYLDKPYTLLSNPKEARENFFTFARSRIKYVSPDKLKELISSTSVPVNPSATFDCGCAIYEFTSHIWFTRQDSGIYKVIKALSILIIPEHFIPPFASDDYSDLIPIVIEHELWELWLILSHGLLITDPGRRHLFARRKEYRYALATGKAERLLSFMLKDRSPKLEKEYTYVRSKI